jgi:hypothetical protein
LEGEVLRKLHKRDALVEDDSSYADLPLLVAFFFDQLAEFLPFYPLSFNEHVSGILTIKEDVVMPTAFKKLSPEEQGRYLEKLALDDDQPPSSTDFVLLQNEAALRKVPRDFERQCLADTV